MQLYPLYTVHDCFATTADKMPILKETVIELTAQMYTDVFPLSQLRDLVMKTAEADPNIKISYNDYSVPTFEKTIVSTNSKGQSVVKTTKRMFITGSSAQTFD